MAKVRSIDSVVHVADVIRERDENHARISLVRHALAKRRSVAGHHKVALAGNRVQVWVGNHTGNANVPLRKNARVRGNLQSTAQDNTYTYVVDRFHPDTDTALRVLSEYRYIMASRKKVVHHAKD